MPQAYYLVGPRTFELGEYDNPPLGPRDVRLESVLSGISHGTELNLYRGTAPFAEKHFDGERRLFMPNEERAFHPMLLGYEMVSRVAAVGSEVTEVHVGDHVAVFGLGAIGLIAVQLARLSGATYVAAVDPIARRREMAASLGADEAIDPTQRDPGEALKYRDGPRGVDVAIEASGAYPALQQATRSAHLGGTVVTLGYYQGGASAVFLGEEWHHNRLNLVSSMGVWNCPSRHHPMWDRPRVSRTVMELLARGRVQVEQLITQTFPYSQVPEAYRFIDEHPTETIKAVLSYG